MGFWTELPLQDLGWTRASGRFRGPGAVRFPTSSSPRTQLFLTIQALRTIPIPERPTASSALTSARPRGNQEPTR